MPKIRDLGINSIPVTPDCGAKTCPPLSACPAGTTIKTAPKRPEKYAGELTHEAIELLHSQLQQRMAVTARTETGPSDLAT